MRVYRGKDPAYFPSRYPKACEWRGTVQQQQNYIYSPGTFPGGCASDYVHLWISNRDNHRHMLSKVCPQSSDTQMGEPSPVKDKDPHVELADEVALQEMTGYERQAQPEDMRTRAELM